MSHSRSSAALVIALTLLAAGCGQPEPSAEQTAALREQLRADAENFAGRNVASLIDDGAAMQLGEQLFEAHCGACHGAESSGKRGAIDLRQRVFNYGSTEDAVRTTISQGRIAEMPGVGSQFGEVDLGQLVAYVRSLNFESSLTSYAERGKQLFEENCAKCHGPEGLGESQLGAPNLADDYWQHGDSMMNVRLVITRGVDSQCPGIADEASSAEIELLTAYVLRMIGSPAGGSNNGAAPSDAPRRDGG